jgi:hypothetical protein
MAREKPLPLPGIKPCLMKISFRDVDWIEIARQCPIKILASLRVQFGRHTEM